MTWRRRPLLVFLTGCVVHAVQAGAGAPALEELLGVPAPASLEGVLRHVSPGLDAFPEEPLAQDLARRLRERGARLRREARGGPSGRALPAGAAIEVVRAPAAVDPVLGDDASFSRELSALAAGFESLEVAEFLVTSLEVEGGPDPGARTVVRYDLAGTVGGGGRAENVGQWRLHWRRGPEGWSVSGWEPLEGLESRTARPLFTEVTGAAFGGIESFHRQLVPAHDAWMATLDSAFEADTMGLHGISAGDADGDGHEDLYVSQPAGLPNRLFRNRGDGRFEDVTAASGTAVLDSTSQSLFADVDNDGDQDLLLVTRNGLLLFLGDGAGRFAPDPGAFRFRAPLRGSPMAAALADYDRDGFIDVYLCTYTYFIGASEHEAGVATPYHDARNGPPNVLLRNDGRGRFVDVTREAGLSENNDRFSFAAAWADYDGDGWPDLLVANDFGRKNLYRNEGMKDGAVRFRDVAAEAGVLDHGAGMSATWLDYDNDGRLDIYFGNMWSAAGRRVTSLAGFKPDAPREVRDVYRRHARGNTLLRNRGDGTFEDLTLAARAEMGRWAWSSDALDFDGDGWQDLYVVNGMLTRGAAGEETDSFFWRQVIARSPLSAGSAPRYEEGWRAMNRLLLAGGSQAPHERNVLLRNDGRGGFDEVGGTLGLDLDQDGRSFAVFDYDGDGDPDLAVFTPRASPQLRLFRNDAAPARSWLALRLRGASNRDAVGARVTVRTGEGRQTQVVLAGSGFLSQRSKELLFGLGASRRVEDVTITWPSGRRQVIADVAAGLRIRVEEGRDEPEAEPLGTSPEAAPGPPLVAEAPSESWLYDPFPVPGPLRPAKAPTRPALLLLLASGAPASRAALAGLVRERDAYREAGVGLLAVDLERTGRDRALADEAARAGVAVAEASEEAARTWAVLNRHLFARREPLGLPTALLLDAEGAIAKVYRGAPAASRVAEDARRLAGSSAERLARAVPFEGTFHALPERRDPFPFALELAEQGLDAAALAAFETATGAAPSAVAWYNLGTLYAKAGRSGEARAAFEQALDLDPRHAEAGNSLGALLAQAGDLSGALERFQVALEARPDFPDALNNRGYALFQSGREDEARVHYEKALALEPDLAEALNNLGILLGGRGDLARAEAHFRRAVASRPEYAEAANNLALVLATRGDSGEAVAVLESSLRESPGFEMTYVTLCRVHLESGRTREGLQVLERLLQRNPTHPLGLALARQLRSGG